MDRKTPDVGTDPIGLLARTAPTPLSTRKVSTPCAKTQVLPPAAGPETWKSAKPSFIQYVMSSA